MLVQFLVDPVLQFRFLDTSFQFLAPLSKQAYHSFGIKHFSRLWYLYQYQLHSFHSSLFLQIIYVPLCLSIISFFQNKFKKGNDAQSLPFSLLDCHATKSTVNSNKSTDRKSTRLNSSHVSISYA